MSRCRGLAKAMESRPLTNPEIEVLGLLAKGHRAKRGGDALGISPRTIKVHAKSIVSKLGANNTTHAVAVAVHRGLVRP